MAARPAMDDIDACYKAAGLWPDRVLSGHAHLHQHFTRNINQRQTPYIVAGSGGYEATAPMKLPPLPVTVGDHTLEKAPIVDYGYLTIETDAKTLTVTFKTADSHGVAVRDAVGLDLTTGKITSGAGAPGGAGRGKPRPNAKHKR